MIKFLLNDKVIYSMSIEGLMSGEMHSTRELLAYESKVKINDITVKVAA